MRHFRKVPLFTAFVFILLIQSNEISPIQTQAEDHIFGQRLELDSKSLGEKRGVYIHLPAGYEKDSSRYPVIFFLDGGDYFIPFAGIVKYLTSYGMIPEMIVVAVEQGDRLKEFTYTRADEKTGDWPTSGGADSFRKFLQDELIPYVETSFRIHPFKILVGHSLGGLFAVETLSRSPGLFQTTIALSPSLYWNQFEWLRNAEQFLDRIDPLRHYLFISNEQKGEEETGFLDRFEQLVANKAPPGFSYQFSCLEGENHASVALPALYADLKQLFQGWNFPGEAWETGPEGVKTHFQSLTERFGFEVPITEEFLNGHAFHGLRRHDAPDEAIVLFRFCLSLYPESSEAHEGIGEAYARKGMTEKAIASYQRALELNPASTNAKTRMDELKKRMP